MRRRASVTPAASAATSGTTRLPASVGVDARTSATRSSSGWSTSWPIALTTGVRHAATARSSVSLLNGSRSSSAPPPRAMTMTSTVGSSSSACTAATTSVTAVGPCTATARTSNRTTGHRRRAFSTTSRSAALARPQTRPTVRGRNGSGRLRSSANSPSAASSRRRCSSRASSSPTPDRPQLVGGEAQRTPPRPQLRTGVDDDPRAVHQRRRQPVEHLRVHGDLERQVDVRVAQRQVAGRLAGTARELHHLSLDPDPGCLGDVVRELGRQQADRPRVLRAGLPGGGRDAPRCGLGFGHGVTLRQPV